MKQLIVYESNDREMFEAAKEVLKLHGIDFDIIEDFTPDEDGMLECRVCSGLGHVEDGKLGEVQCVNCGGVGRMLA